MINKSHLDMLEFEDIEDYFDAILDNYVMGKDARDLFNQLSDKQKEIFFDYVETTYYYEAENEEDLSMWLARLADALK